MAFAEPAYLVALAVVLPAGVLVLLRLDRRRAAALERFGEPELLGRSSELPSRRWRLLDETLALLGLCLVLTALARPQLGEKPVMITRTGRDVVFALDLSRSMTAEDVTPSRLAAAKAAVREMLDASPDDRVGLVVFGGSAFLQVPLTLDRAAFDLFLNSARPEDVSDPGTDIPEALQRAAEAFGEDSRPRYRVVVVLSDGESFEPDIDRGVGALRRSGIRSFTVGVGSREGSPIPVHAGTRLLGYHRDASGQIVVTRLEEAGLRRVAEETDGTYVRLAGPGSVRRLSVQLSQLEKREISSRSFTELIDRYQWPLALALGALLVQGAIPQAGRPARRRRSP